MTVEEMKIQRDLLDLQARAFADIRNRKDFYDGKTGKRYPVTPEVDTFLLCVIETWRAKIRYLESDIEKIECGDYDEDAEHCVL